MPVRHVTRTQENHLQDAIRFIEQRPCTLNEIGAFDPVESLGLTREQYDAVREHMQKSYDLFVQTWVVPRLRAVINPHTY